MLTTSKIADHVFLKVDDSTDCVALSDKHTFQELSEYFRSHGVCRKSLLHSHLHTIIDTKWQWFS